MKLVLINRKTGEIRIVNAGDPMPHVTEPSDPNCIYWDVAEAYAAYLLGRQEKAAEVLEALTREFFKGDQP